MQKNFDKYTNWLFDTNDEKHEWFWNWCWYNAKKSTILITDLRNKRDVFQRFKVQVRAIAGKKCSFTKQGNKKDRYINILIKIKN